ncbi:MAG: hypothetical protein ACJ74U_17185 [Jatrophihabitantaceae bacterium]
MTTGAVGGAGPAGEPRPAVAASSAAAEQSRLQVYAGLLLTILLDAALLAIWLAAIVAIHAEYEWAKDTVPAATAFMEVLEWILLVITAVTLLGWVAIDAWRFLKKVWAAR